MKKEVPSFRRCKKCGRIEMKFTPMSNHLHRHTEIDVRSSIFTKNIQYYPKKLRI